MAPIIIIKLFQHLHIYKLYDYFFLFFSSSDACIHHPGVPVFHDAMKVSGRHLFFLFKINLSCECDCMCCCRGGLAVRRGVRTSPNF